MSNFYKDLVKGLNDTNTHLLSDGGNSAEFGDWVDTGCYALNALVSGSMYGGIADNKVTAIAGAEATGKTFFALGIVNNFLQKPDAGTIYYDTESAVTKAMMEARGINPERLVVSEPQTIQHFRHLALQTLERYQSTKNRPPMMMVLDSLGQLSTTKEMEDTAKGAETKDMTKPAVIKATFRTLGLTLARAKVPLIVTNHTYDVIGAYVPTKEMSGGSGLKYTASTILMLSKKKDKNGTDVIGNIIKVRTQKSRFTKEQKTVELKLSYTSGLDRYYGLLDIANKYGIIKQVATRMEMPDGTKVYAKTIYNDPTKYFTPDIMERLEIACNQEFMYGQSTEDPFDESLYDGEESGEVGEE